MRPIDADALMEDYPVRNDPVRIALMCAPTLTLDEMRPKGEWDENHCCTNCGKRALSEEKPDYYACGLLTLFYVDSDYCPYCGAKMGGGK